MKRNICIFLATHAKFAIVNVVFYLFWCIATGTYTLLIDKQRSIYHVFVLIMETGNMFVHPYQLSIYQYFGVARSILWRCSSLLEYSRVNIRCFSNSKCYFI
jgi:hypothetical protein